MLHLLAQKAHQRDQSGQSELWFIARALHPLCQPQMFTDCGFHVFAERCEIPVFASLRFPADSDRKLMNSVHDHLRCNDDFASVTHSAPRQPVSCNCLVGLNAPMTAVKWSLAVLLWASGKTYLLTPLRPPLRVSCYFDLITGASAVSIGLPSSSGTGLSAVTDLYGNLNVYSVYQPENDLPDQYAALEKIYEALGGDYWNAAYKEDNVVQLQTYESTLSTSSKLTNCFCFLPGRYVPVFSFNTTAFVYRCDLCRFSDVCQSACFQGSLVHNWL